MASDWAQLAAAVQRNKLVFTQNTSEGLALRRLTAPGSGRRGLFGARFYQESDSTAGCACCAARFVIPDGVELRCEAIFSGAMKVTRIYHGDVLVHRCHYDPGWKPADE